MYKKRSGTSGLHGQLYETKILSLLNFRAKHDDDIEEFRLATNVDLIGDFDDICFRSKVKGFAKEIAVYIQTKHRETDKVLSLNINQDLARYFKSYLKIRRAFGAKNTDKLFEGSYNETECLFVMYTNAKYDFKNDLIETEYTAKLKELIGTSQTGSYLQPTYATKDVELLNKIIMEEEMAALAEHFAKLLNKEVFMMDELVLCYHYILAQKVFEIPDIIHDDAYRIASFRKDFFDTDERFVLIFKNTLYEQVLLRRKINTSQILNLIEDFFSRSSEVEVLSELIGTVIAYKNGKFEFIKNVPEDLKRQLNKVSVLQSTVDEAIDQAARKILEHSTFKVPLSFGNKDLTIRGKDTKVESRLNYLASKIFGLINDAEPNTIINIEESLGDGLLKVNGGLAGAVGNVFVPDENSKLMKFADNIESIKGDLAKRLYVKLQNKTHNLCKYLINVKVKKFPKLSFHSGEHDMNLVKDYLRQLFFFTNQSNEKNIGEILKREIGYPYYGIHLFEVKADAIFLKYHDAIQEWWAKPGTAEYLTKHSKQFENATQDIINQPLISVINFINKFKLQKVKYTFNAAAVRSFELLLNQQCKTNVNVIVTDNCKLTVAKLTQYLNEKKHVVLDLESISNLLPKDYKTLRTELEENKETVIFVNYENWCERFNDIVRAVKARSLIITKEKPDKIFSDVNDSKNNLMDLSHESQQTFLRNTKVIFQDEEVALDLFVIDKNITKLIKGDIFNEMFEHTIFKIGLPIRNHDYDEFKDLYTDRRVSRIRKTAEDAFHDVKDKVIQTLYDLHDHVILITAMPGMGKSTLLTHLSINTKERYPNTWIVRINLLEYSKIFSQWQTDKTVIDRILSLKFMCHVALGVAEENIKAKLKTKNNVVSLKYCSGDAVITFGFEMFLHFYNSGTLMFLFDGFDEIFPHYANEALALVKSVRSYPRRHKIWITSRSYNHIKDVLEQEFGRSYEIEPFTDVEQKTYLKKHWIKRSLKGDDLEGIKSIVAFAPCHRPFYSNYYSREDPITLPSFKVYYNIIDILKAELDGYADEIIVSPYSSNTQQDDSNKLTYTHDFFATPLHLYLVAESLYTLRWRGMKQGYLCNHDGKPELVCFREVMAFELYQHFVETKLEKIRFNEKNKIDLCKPDNMLTYERERVNFISKHKKLGAYAIFYPDVDLIFNGNELKEVTETIDMLKIGTEKSGFIHSVAGDIPLFIHKLIAEYFAAEYIYDLLKSDITDETRKLITGLSKKGEVYEMLAGKRLAEERKGRPFLWAHLAFAQGTTIQGGRYKSKLELIKRSLTYPKYRRMLKLSSSFSSLFQLAFTQESIVTFKGVFRGEENLKQNVFDNFKVSYGVHDGSDEEKENIPTSQVGKLP